MIFSNLVVRIRHFGVALLFLAAAMLVVADAHAQGDDLFINAINSVGSDPLPKPKGLVAKTEEMVSAAISAVVNVFGSAAPTVTGIGTSLVASLLVASVGFAGLRMIGGALDLSGAIAEVVKAIIVSSVCLAAIDPMGGRFVPFIGNGSLGDFVVNGFYRLAGLGSSNPIAANMAAWVDNIHKLWDMPIIPPGYGSWSTLLFVVGNFDKFAGVVILKVLSMLAMVIACVLSLGHLLMAEIQIKLALFMAPLMVPWLLFKPLNFLFTSWLKGLISGGVLLLIGQLFAKGGGIFLQQMALNLPNGDQQGVYYDATSVVSVYAAVLVATALFIFVAMKLGNLAQSLMSGGLAPGISMMDMKQAASAMKSMGKTLASVPKAAMGAAGAAAGGMGAVQAAQSAANAAASAAGGPVAAGGSLMNPTRVPVQAANMSPVEKAKAFMEGQKAFAQSRKTGAGLRGSLSAAKAAGSALYPGGSGKPAAAPAAPTGGSKAGRKP